ncbi:pentatricopeptide repeat-containing protein At2g34400-like [Selaginella moellendorffii]|uniref:pentatricopeptide repeat-containing protein At2g34400-like n=1 Tax=Selaginella moellendorffii TaxID=88036 RepID=UPI000D1CDCFC|nr:pentatricopeptide repeat-containing protein At2g34400-like [Selaginella moellendorffii]|eukprot:XP_024516113.1 pentatricopeptide repeat-containing protein At2g34400-like [Selaginella moellendorffii]
MGPVALNHIMFLRSAGRVFTAIQQRHKPALVDSETGEGKLALDLYQIFVASALVDMYMRCGSLADGRGVFEKMAAKHGVVELSHSGKHGEWPGRRRSRALRSNETGSLNPDATTYVAVLKACGSLEALEAGRKVEAKISSAGIHMVVCNSMVDFYGKCGSMADARRVFEWIRGKRRGIVSSH